MQKLVTTGETVRVIYSSDSGRDSDGATGTHQRPSGHPQGKGATSK